MGGCGRPATLLGQARFCQSLLSSHTTIMAASSLCRTVAHSLLRCRCSGPFAAAAATAVTAPASARLLAASSLRHVPVRQASTSSSAQHPAAAHFQRKKGRQGRRGINDKTAGLGALAGTLLSLSLMGLFGQEESGSQATSSIESINYLPQVSLAIAGLRSKRHHFDRADIADC